MAAIDQVRAHYDRQAVRQIEVPEWGDESGPLIIHFGPINLAEKQRILRAGEADGRLFSLVEALVIKARDAEGKPLFTIADKKFLRERADPDVIARIVAEMMSAVDVETAEKN